MTWAVCNNTLLLVPTQRVEVGTWDGHAMGFRGEWDIAPAPGVGVDSVTSEGVVTGSTADLSFVETWEYKLT